MDLFNQITRTRVVLPHHRSDLLSRQRLLDLLYELLNYKLIIVTAPAGYGKTSLLVDMAHQVELPVCWYTIDTLDRDPQRFIAHFIAAIAHRFAEFGPWSAATLDGITLDQTGLDRLVTTIVNEAYEHIQEHFVLVLDDYYLVNNSREINYFLNRFVQQVDENCHLIISSRELLELSDLVLMVSRSQVGGLGLNDLAFRAEEIRALVLQNYRLTMPEAVAEELIQATEGWITGLLLSTQTIWQGMADQLRLAQASGVGLYDYLAQQVLDQQSSAVRDFLLRTSLLEEFDAELCEAVLGPAGYPEGEDWPDLMKAVGQRNLFVMPVDDKGEWLRYHHLFQDFLQGRLEVEQPAERVDILRRLAMVHLEGGAWEKAHDIYWRLGDVTAIADLIEQAGLPLVHSGRFATVAEWLDALPAKSLASRPVLLFLRGYVAVILGEVERGLTLLNQGEAACRQANDRPRLVRALLWRSVAHRFLGKYRDSLADADEVLALTGPDESSGSIRAEALKARGISLNQIGQLSEAIECLERSLAAYDILGEAQNVAILLVELGMAYVSTGRYMQALAYYNRALDYWREVGNVTQQANLLNNLGVLHHLRGEYEQAGLTFEEGLICARQSGYTRIEAYILGGIGDLYTDLDAPGAALGAYCQAGEIARRVDERFLLLHLGLAEAGLARSQEDWARAHELLAAAGRLAQESGSDYEQGLHHLEAGRLALIEGRLREAVVHQEEAVRCFDGGGQRLEGARAYLYLAIACQSMGEEQLALEHLEHTFRVASDLESWHPLVVTGWEARKLLATVQAGSTVERQALRLLGQITQFEQEIPRFRRNLRQYATTVPFAPPRLTIQALGQIRVALDRKLVTSAEWQSQRRVREILFYLLAHPDGVTRETVGVVFWPDSSPSQLRLQFGNAIYRLRRALMKEVILYDPDQERYYFNRQLDYEYDVEKFRQEVERAQAAVSPEEQIAAYQAAIDLYRGFYLPGLDGTWIWTEREGLEQAYITANLKLAEFYLERSDYNLALKYCRQVLTVDLFQEEAHRHAMRAHAALGNRAAVIRQFEQCQQVLLEEIDAPVSPQTRELYETLTR